ncbi:TonB-dependent receptor [Pyxidicoccus caerfyrddinensis]|uniref:TonB-dependent receptor n=1 Tax=Pyxidicoccus caerfyrddinensis TaxID=2709663 RepID=UPI0013D9A2AF|nr:TonB-dependent receptor [Pyxidicoccus caerfyrddinensis]
MRMWEWCRAVGVLAVFLASGALGAEGHGVIFGTVKDAATWVPVADVVITATSPSMQGEQTVVTDALGEYRIPGLPPGTYTVRFEKELLRPYARADVLIREGYSTRLDASLIPETLGEEVEFGCGPPTIDVGSTKTGQDLFLEFDLYGVVSRPSGPLGAARSAEDLAPFVPGVLDVTEGLSINGASVFENEYRLDGLSIRDAVLGLNALSLGTELTWAGSIVTGGYLPESGHATGGRLETMTRSGSNELHGSVFAFWTPGLLEGRRASRGLASQDTLKHQGDFGATLGGPVLEDTLWFFAGVTPALSRVERTRILQAPGEDGSSSRTFDDARSLQAVGKLTYLINQDHNVSLTLVTAPSSREDWSAQSMLTALHHSGALVDKKVLLDVHAGWLSQRVTGMGDPTLDRYQANARVLWWARWLGTHTVKAGVDTEWLVYERAGSRTPSTVLGGFVQDSWSLANRLTLNVGARYDMQRLEGGAAGSDPVTSSRLSPRVGLVLDPGGNGWMKVFAHYGRFQGLIPLGLLDAPASGSDPVAEVTLDPDLAPMASHEVVTGLEYEVLPTAVLGGTYTYRELENGLALVPRTDGSGVVLGNPGAGLAADSQRTARTYHAVTVELRLPYIDGWLGRVGYTWSKLTGNFVSPFAVWDGLAPIQRLPLDRPHVIRAYGAREFRFGPDDKLRADVGASYLGASGLLLEGAEKRTPWVQSLDVYLGVRYALRKGHDVTFRLDAFNVLNAQEPAQAEARDASEGVAPVTVRYQAPRQVRFGMRYDF